MEKLLQKKKIIIITGLIFLVLIAFILFLNQKDAIVFNDKYDEIEYGESFDYKKTIDSVSPEKTKIVYPDIEVKEVGEYNLSFKYKINGKQHKQEKKFVVKDTKLPKIIVRNNETIEVALNSQYDIFANIVDIKNLSDEAKSNRVSVTSSDYNKLKKKILKANEKIINRVINTKKDIVDLKTERNMLLYTTDFNNQVEGEYNVKVLAIDENYNMSEAEWKIKVVPNDKLVNSGGSVICTYNNDESKNTDAYATQYDEIYYYNEDILVNHLEFKTIMSFKEGYNTAQNADALLAAINDKYQEFTTHEGVTINVEYNGEAVITKIQMDFSIYDIKNDPLNLLETKNKGKVKMSKVIDKIKDKATCDINI